MVWYGMANKIAHKYNKKIKVVMASLNLWYEVNLIFSHFVIIIWENQCVTLTYMRLENVLQVLKYAGFSF